jgi:hypothetical protein
MLPADLYCRTHKGVIDIAFSDQAAVLNSRLYFFPSFSPSFASPDGLEFASLSSC